MLTVTNNKVMLSDKAYSVGKKLVQIVIPAFSSLYFGLSGIWGLPATEQVVGTLALVATFLGACLGISSKQYDTSDAAHDGEMVLEEQADRTLYALKLNLEPDELAQKSSISFKVVPKK